MSFNEFCCFLAFHPNSEDWYCTDTAEQRFLIQTPFGKQSWFSAFFFFFSLAECFILSRKVWFQRLISMFSKHVHKMSKYITTWFSTKNSLLFIDLGRLFWVWQTHLDVSCRNVLMAFSSSGPEWCLQIKRVTICLSQDLHEEDQKSLFRGAGVYQEQIKSERCFLFSKNYFNYLFYIFLTRFSLLLCDLLLNETCVDVLEDESLLPSRYLLRFGLSSSGLQNNLTTNCFSGCAPAWLKRTSSLHEMRGTSAMWNLLLELCTHYKALHRSWSTWDVLRASSLRP